MLIHPAITRSIAPLNSIILVFCVSAMGRELKVLCQRVQVLIVQPVTVVATEIILQI